ncbi:putative C-5 cytosine DNA methylase [Klebsiella phage vB_KaeD_HazelMika]|nr:putative C-5 cytosine DNA methylase [Klebsiella phage vB_KaeD_HazelMika]
MKKVVWSLFDGSGIMGLPWATAGYQVYCFNADSGNHGEYEVKMKHENLHYVNMWIDKDFQIKCGLLGIPEPGIIFGFPDCTLFAHSGAKHFREEDELAYALENAKIVKALGESFGVPWMIENPVGKLSNPDMMGKPNFYFHPRDFGYYVNADEGSWHPKMPLRDGYTKKTCIWCGEGFEQPKKMELPDDEGIHFFWGWKFLGGKSAKTKQLRSLTPRGFARAVFQANAK